MLELIYNEANMDVIMLSEPIIEQLILDFDINPEKAIDLFYSSKTFTQLADENTKLYQKSWQEIYELLKQELK